MCALCKVSNCSLLNCILKKEKKRDRDEHWVSTLKLQHNKECKGLLVQIRYLKAKFTREALFRDHLGYQKQYLLEILSQFERGWGVLSFSLSS